MPVVLNQTHLGSNIVLLRLNVVGSFIKSDIEDTVKLLNAGVEGAYRAGSLSIILSGDWSQLEFEFLNSTMEIIRLGVGLYSHKGLLAISAYSTIASPGDWAAQILGILSKTFGKRMSLSSSYEAAYEIVMDIAHDKAS